ncbi:hypothetical protein Peur_006383 [Populus x canadensis]
MNRTGITPDQLNAVICLEDPLPHHDYTYKTPTTTTPINLPSILSVAVSLQYFGFLLESFLESLYMGFKVGCCSESGDGSCDKQNEEDYHFK